MTLGEGRLKDTERLTRFAMAVTLCTAGISKFFSHGAFHQYNGELFRSPQLRIHLEQLTLTTEHRPSVRLFVG